MDDVLLKSITKECKRCHAVKPLGEFHRNNSIKDPTKHKRESTCKLCRSEMAKERLRRDPIAREVHLAKRREWDRKHRQDEKRWEARRRAEYIETHGIPTCGCGCGEPVSFKNGKPYRFRVGHGRRTEESHRKYVESFTSDNIDREAFRKAIKKIKVERHLTWQEMADICGLSYSNLNSIIFKKRDATMKRKTAEQILKRLAGISTPPTEHEKRMMQEHLANR